MLNQQNDLKSLVSQSLFTAIGAQPTMAHAGVAFTSQSSSNKYRMQPAGQAHGRNGGNLSRYTPFDGPKKATTMSASSTNQFAGKAGGLRMSALNGSSVVNKAISKKQAVSGNFFQAAPTMSAQVPRAQVAGASSVGFQASSFFSTALANTGFQAGRQAAAPRSSIVMKAGDQMIERSMKYECYKDLPHYTGNKFKDELMLNAKKLATPGKGILASDESTGTIGNRFKQIDVENTHENRIAYRELLFTTPKLEDHISGAIIYDETARDKGSDGKDLIQHLKDKDILIGLKVDTGMVIIEGTNDESATQGLDGLGNRCKEYYEMGTRFAKWRAVVKIGDGCPSDVSIKETAHSLARYGNICQHNGIVPIIEPEILTDGTHDIKECARISEKVFNAVMAELIEQGLLLEGLLLKPNMILPGAECPEKACPEEVAFYTVRTLSRTITPAVPGITFLSGGQSEENASLNLNAINQLAPIKHPWNMSFSYGRALQTTVLDVWKGKPENVEAAQTALYERCKANGEAALGKYEGGSGSTKSDYVANYTY